MYYVMYDIVGCTNAYVDVLLCCHVINVFYYIIFVIIVHGTNFGAKANNRLQDL